MPALVILGAGLLALLGVQQTASNVNDAANKPAVKLIALAAVVYSVAQLVKAAK